MPINNTKINKLKEPKPQVVIFDLEGTLTDQAHRADLWINGDHRKWHQQIVNDTPNKEVIDYFMWIQSHTNLHCVIATAKEEEYQQEAYEWLSRHMPRMLMSTPSLFRKPGNLDPSPAVKLGMLNHIREYANPVLAIDDRFDVCEMFTQHGVPAFHYMKALTPKQLTKARRKDG